MCIHVYILIYIHILAYVYMYVYMYINIITKSSKQYEFSEIGNLHWIKHIFVILSSRINDILSIESTTVREAKEHDTNITVIRMKSRYVHPKSRKQSKYSRILHFTVFRSFPWFWVIIWWFYSYHNITQCWK